MKRPAAIAVAVGGGSLAFGAFAQQALPPRFDHVVVVILENLDRDDLIGSPAAPYVNSLAADGTTFTGMYGLTHPSSANYGELFSGFHNGMTDGAPPPGAPLSTPNLG